VLRYAFELARSRARKQSRWPPRATASPSACPGGTARADGCRPLSRRHLDKQHIDILSARFVLQPQRFDVVAASNLFGDILTDLGPASTGTIGIAPVGEPEPREALPLAVRAGARLGTGHLRPNIANPVAMIWSRALMLDFLTHGQGAGRAAHDAIVRAIEQVLVEGPRTGDLGGSASTTEMGEAIARKVAAGV
jgi:tartrate dehydrogenase/decarboxylase/D-malate dehydrogenase